MGDGLDREPMAGYRDSSVSERRELKYMLSPMRAERMRESIAPFMRFDPYSRDLERVGYPIVSLYLDTADYRLCRQSVEGIKNRCKLRIRSYSDDKTEPLFLEMKSRVDQIIIKKRARVSRDSVAGLLDGSVAVDRSGTAEAEIAENFLSRVSQYRAAPVARVRYRREAYESMDGDPLRMTFDRELEFTPTFEPHVGLNGSGWRSARLPGVIFEIKFTGAYPAWLQDLARRFELSASSIPKYVLSIQRAGLGGPMEI